MNAFNANWHQPSLRRLSSGIAQSTKLRVVTVLDGGQAEQLESHDPITEPAFACDALGATNVTNAITSLVLFTEERLSVNVLSIDEVGV